MRIRLISGGNSLLQQGTSGDTYTVRSWNLDGFTGTRVAASALSALYALCGEQTSELQTFTRLQSLNEHILECVDGGLGLCLGQVGLLCDLRNEIRLVVCHAASFGSGAFFAKATFILDTNTFSLQMWPFLAFFSIILCIFL